ncbi:hypothetical protein BC629DRAFT_438066 [Irpex lacteus]|nr:hypothetical protein BC629DRAFT_438066 [Irpex lacteus]
MFQAVPLELLAHTVRATLKPTILVEEIPLLLTSLGHIEHVRLIVMKKLKKMSQLNQSIRVARSKARADSALSDVEHNRVEDIALTRKEEIYVEEAFARGPELRAAFRKSVAEFSLMHAWETWCSPNHAELGTLLKMYFPLESLWGTDVVELEKHHLFHEGLDDDERNALLEAASTLLTLLAKYEKEKRKKLAPKPLTNTFREIYALDIDSDDLVASTIWYVNEVEEDVARIRSMLEDED